MSIYSVAKHLLLLGSGFFSIRVGNAARFVMLGMYNPVSVYMLNEDDVAEWPDPVSHSGIKIVLVGVGVKVMDQIQSSALLELELDIEATTMFVLITVMIPPGSVVVVTRSLVKLPATTTGALEFPPGVTEKAEELIVDAEEPPDEEGLLVPEEELDEP